MFRSVLIPIIGDDLFPPEEFVVDDLNNDNQSDLIVLSTVLRMNSYFQILLGNNNGTFRTPINIRVNDYYCCLIISDVNHDKYRDLIYVSIYTNKINVCFGNGDGTFQVSTTPRTTLLYAPDVINIAQLNSDNYVDVVVVYPWGKRAEIDIFYGNGDGTFVMSKSILVEVGYSSRSFQLGHFNDDAYFDFILANSFKNYILVCLGYGNGTFKTQKIFVGPNFRVTRLAIGDFNNDTRIDIVALYNSNNVISLILGNDQGWMSYKKNYLTEINSFILFSIMTTDINMDGFLDIVISGTEPYAINVLLGYDNEHFLVQTIYTFETIVRFTSYFLIDDFNSDDCPDIVAHNLNGTLTLLLNACNCAPINILEKDDLIHP